MRGLFAPVTQKQQEQEKRVLGVRRNMFPNEVFDHSLTRCSWLDKYLRGYDVVILTRVREMETKIFKGRAK